MRSRLVLAVYLALALSCATPLEQASARYRSDRDFASLKVLQSNLRAGMSRAQVERLLGPPHYSPTAGQQFYSSTIRNHVLVVDYRKGDQVTEHLQRFDLEAVGD